MVSQTMANFKNQAVERYSLDGRYFELEDAKGNVVVTR
jgi:hypothetical protein